MHKGAASLPHIFAAACSGAVLASILLIGRSVAIQIERKTTEMTVSEDFLIKNQGLAFQDAAAQRDKVLLLYGSSELGGAIANHAPQFFASAPTGFEVCPVGRKGFTSLVMLQRIAALGSDARSHKIAISVSPSFFLRRDLNPGAYAGNFSLPAASGAIFGNGLNWSLKHDLAKRMREFPGTLSKSALLNAAVNGIASDNSLGHLLFAALIPLGKVENAIYDLQDHLEAMTYLATNTRKIVRERGRVRPNELPRKQSSRTGVADMAGAGDAAFRDRINNAREWNDIELLFRTLKQLRVRAFVISVPLKGAAYDAIGISRSARQTYYDRLRALAQQYQIPCEDFEDHDADPAFELPHNEHPTSEGWKFYDAALDNFFHQPKRFAFHQ